MVNDGDGCDVRLLKLRRVSDLELRTRHHPGSYFSIDEDAILSKIQQRLSRDRINYMANGISLKANRGSISEHLTRHPLSSPLQLFGLVAFQYRAQWISLNRCSGTFFLSERLRETNVFVCWRGRRRIYRLPCLFWFSAGGYNNIYTSLAAVFFFRFFSSLLLIYLHQQLFRLSFFFFFIR